MNDLVKVIARRIWSLDPQAEASWRKAGYFAQARAVIKDVGQICVDAVDAEEEAEGEPPQSASIAMLAVGVTETVRATIRATKRSIRARIVAVIDEADE